MVPQREKLRYRLGFFVFGLLGVAGWQGASPLLGAASGSALAWYRGDGGLGEAWAERRRLKNSKPYKCRSVYYKVQPNANKIRGKDLKDSKKEIIREGKQCKESMNSVITFLLSIVYVSYLFVGIAIVCDELFVASLEVISEKWDLSDDVSGATLMAAGGSAPELATSFIGTFQGSTVGLGTIVGSAVFNVLFVIGMCAMFSKETLTLTWWPLFRDCSYAATRPHTVHSRTVRFPSAHR